MERGLGADPLEAAISAATDRVMERIMPKISEMAAGAANAAQPVISKVLREDVLPWLVVGIAGVAGVSALIGAIVATKRRG